MSEQKEFVCPECGDKTSSLNGLWGHLQQKHGWDSYRWSEYKEKQGFEVETSSDSKSRPSELLGSDRTVYLPRDTRFLIDECLKMGLGEDADDIVARAVKFYFAAHNRHDLI